MKKKLLSLYDRTLKNCEFYERENDKIHLLAEIGCLRGISYCLEENGINTFELSGLMYFINISNELMKEANQEG